MTVSYVIKYEAFNDDYHVSTVSQFHMNPPFKVVFTYLFIVYTPLFHNSLNFSQQLVDH